MRTCKNSVPCLIHECLGHCRCLYTLILSSLFFFNALLVKITYRKTYLRRDSVLSCKKKSSIQDRLNIQTATSPDPLRVTSTFRYYTQAPTQSLQSRHQSASSAPYMRSYRPDKFRYFMLSSCFGRIHIAHQGKALCKKSISTGFFSQVHIFRASHLRIFEGWHSFGSETAVDCWFYRETSLKRPISPPPRQLMIIFRCWTIEFATLHHNMYSNGESEPFCGEYGAVKSLWNFFIFILVSLIAYIFCNKYCTLRYDISDDSLCHDALMKVLMTR